MRSKNPARSRPLSANVRRLMKMAREAPVNPDVEKIERKFTARDLAYCDMQGNIFMAAMDAGLRMNEFAPLYMNSQLAGVMDYSFSCAGGMETDSVSEFLRVPLLLKSPRLIVDVVMWLDQIVRSTRPDESAGTAVITACLAEGAVNPPAPALTAPPTEDDPPTDQFRDSAIPCSEIEIEALADEYEYAYWLGFIYRSECLLRDESSRMVFGAFSESFMRSFFAHLEQKSDWALADCAPEICRRLDMLLVGKLWK